MARPLWRLSGSGADQRLSPAGIPYRIVNGLLGLHETPEISLTNEETAKRPESIQAWKKIEEWVRAAEVKAALSYARFGFLGNNYSGMLDLYSDFTMISAQAGVHVELLEMCDLDRMLRQVSDDEVKEKRKEMADFFQIAEKESADPRNQRPTEEQLDWSAKSSGCPGAPGKGIQPGWSGLLLPRSSRRRL